MESVKIIEKDDSERRLESKTKAPMKVLWFTTSPSLSRGTLDGSYNVGTSWIEAMEALVHQNTNIELALAFIWKGDKHVKHFTFEGSSSQYYALPRRPIGKLANLFRQFFCLPEPRSGISDYLEVVNRFKPDVINFFGTETPFPQILQHIKTPHVIWFQGNLTVYQRKWYAGISMWQSILSESPKDFLLARSDLHAYFSNKKFTRREKEYFKTAQNFIGRTDWDRRLVSTMAPQAEYFHCEEVMRDLFYKFSWQPRNDRSKYILVSTFRDNLYKGLETAMETFQLLEKVQKRPIEWRIIGVPNNSHYERVCRKITGLQKNTNFKILGLMPSDDIINELLHADVFVHPSHIDNSPNSLCEAMLLGLPIVSTNVGGIPSLLKDPDEGFLVQNGDPYAMAGAILTILTHSDLAETMAKNARQRALARHERQSIIKRLFEVYDKIATPNLTTLEPPKNQREQDNDESSKFERGKVSIVMTTYNRSHMIKKSIDSLLNQTYKNIEIIIVDNGSTDDTPLILQEYNKPTYHNLIRLYRLEKNRHFSGGANYGLDRIRGEWFTILDDDDIAYPNALETMLQVLIDVDPTISAINCNCIDSATGKFSGTGPTNDQCLTFEDTIKLCKGEFWGLTKSELLQNSRFNERLLAYDATFWFQINERANRYYIHQALRLYMTDHGPTDSQNFKKKNRLLKTNMHRVLLEEPFYWKCLSDFLPREFKYQTLKGFLYMYMDGDQEGTNKYLQLLADESRLTHSVARLAMLIPRRVFRKLFHLLPIN